MTEWNVQNLNLTSAVLNIVFEATRGGYQENEDEGDISVDDVGVTSGYCLGFSFKEFKFILTNIEYCVPEFIEDMQNRTITPTGGAPVALPWFCDFGEEVDSPDWCSIEQDMSDHDNWVPWAGLTPTVDSGPSEEARQLGNYTYMSMYIP